MNVMFSDEWDFLGGLFDGAGWWEQFTCSVNPSHGSLPVLLLLLFVLSSLVERPPLRVAMMLLTNFFAVYTGFTILLGPLSASLFAIELAGAVRSRRAVPLHVAALV